MKNYSCDNDPLSVAKNRLAVAIIAFVGVYCVIAVRLFNVCIVPNLHNSNEKVYVEAVDPDIKSFNTKPIKRADIVDRNNAIVATSLPTVHLYVNPKKISDPEISAQKLAEILPDIRYEDILAKFKRKNTFVYVKRNLSPSQQYQINALGIPGLEFENSEKRIYPHKNLFTHLVGTTDIDNNGLTGLEKELDARLQESDIPLELSVDLGIQDTIRGRLLEAVKQFNALGATAILMDVNSGEIISMVSVPDYDPNTNKGYTERSQFNFATKGLYEPGSVLKIFNTALALDSGKVKVADKFDATKPLKLRYNTIRDYRGENRWLSVQEILIYSSNIGSAQMALKVGKKEQQDFVQKIGFLSPLNIEVAEKAKPIVPKRWGEETVATVAYGYGLSITPLHIISAFSAVVNGGLYYKPTLVHNLNKKPDGYRVISDNTSQNMRTLLRNVVIEGSGKRANVLGYEVAGKTGTAQKLSTGGKYVDKKVMTTFVSTFPVSNPKYALLVMMDEPKASKETYGFATSGWNAVPVAGKIITDIAPQLNLEANFDLEEKRKAKIIEARF